MSILSRLRDKNKAYDLCEKELIKLYEDGDSYVTIMAKIYVILDDLK